MCCIRQVASFDGKLSLSARLALPQACFVLLARTTSPPKVATTVRTAADHCQSIPPPSNRRFFVLEAGANGQPSALRYEITVPGNPGSPSFYPKVSSILRMLMAGHAPFISKASSAITRKRFVKRQRRCFPVLD
jgi:hypothetical protein